MGEILKLKTKTNNKLERVTCMATPRRKCRLADINHADVDLRDYSKVIIETIEHVIPEKSVGKSSAKNRSELPFLFSRIALTNRLRRAHNPKVVGSNPASATIRKALV